MWDNFTSWNLTEYNESLPEIVDVWIAGGDFFVSRDMGWDTSFVSTLAEFRTTHSIICPTPDGFSWKRLGAGDVKLHVSLNGQDLVLSREGFSEASVCEGLKDMNHFDLDFLLEQDFSLCKTQHHEVLANDMNCLLTFVLDRFEVFVTFLLPIGQTLQEWSHSTLDLHFMRPETGVEPELVETHTTGVHIPGPDLRFKLAQVTPVMGPTSGGETKIHENSECSTNLPIIVSCVFVAE